MNRRPALSLSMVLATIALAAGTGCAAGKARPAAEPLTNVATMDSSWMPSEQTEINVGDAQAKGRPASEGEITYRPNREAIPRGKVRPAVY